MRTQMNQGVLWALGTTVVSGFSVYINKFGVGQVPDAFVYTTVKNSLVVLGLLAVAGLFSGWKELRQFTPRQWAGWTGLGLIGGGVPFLLFFQGLSQASAPSAALIHKTLFLWVALIGAPTLKEQLGGWQLAGLGILAGGVYLLQPPAGWGWGQGETLILVATLLWACETILAKKVLAGISARTAALGRMGVGAVVMWAFLSVTGRAGAALALDGIQWFWVAITSLFLMAYVWTWYSALKAAPATLVTSVLTLSAVITILLSAVLEGGEMSALQVAAVVLMISGAAAFILRLPHPVAKTAEAG